MAYDGKNSYPASGSGGGKGFSSQDTPLNKYLTFTESYFNHPAWSNYGINSQKCFQFREGKQWTEEERKKIEERGQAPIVENVIKPIIDKLIGQHRKQSTRVIFRGRNYLPPAPNMPADEDVARVLSDVAHFVQQRTNYEFEEAAMFEDGITSGFGVLWTEVKIDADGIPTIVIEHQNCLDIFVDPQNRSYDWNKDSNFIGRWKWTELDYLKKKYPDKAAELEKCANDQWDTPPSDHFQRRNYVDPATKLVRLFEVWYKETVTKKYAYSEEMGKVDITGWKPRKLGALEKDPNIRIFAEPETQMKMAVFCLTAVLEEKDSPHGHNLFPAVPYFIHRQKDGEPYSFVRMLIDPQTEVNKRRSKALHLLMNNQTIFEKGAIADIDALKKEKASPEGDMEYKKGYKFEFVKNIDLATTQMQLLQESKQAIREIAGFNIYDKQEIRSNQQLQRKQMADDLPSVVIFENLRRTRALLGNLLYRYIKQYFDTEMVFNITDSQQMAQTVNFSQSHIDAIKERVFDVIVEDMPETTTIQDEQFGMMLQFFQAMNMPPQMVMQFAPILVRMSQLKDKEQIIEMLQNMQKPAPDLPKFSFTADFQNFAPEVQATIAGTMMQNPQLAQAIMANPQPPAYMAKEQAGIQKQQIKSESDLQKAQIGKPDPQQEFALKAAELEMKQKGHEQDMQHKSEEHQMDMQQKAVEGHMKAQQNQQTHEMNMVNTAMNAEMQRRQMEQQAKTAKKNEKKGKK